MIGVKLAPGRYRVSISDITIGPRLRHYNPDKVTELRESIQRVGLMHPITLRSDGQLIAGRHRLEATRSLGALAVDAEVRECSDLDAELAEIDENLITNGLNLVEIGEHLARRKELLIELGSMAEVGDNQSSDARTTTAELGAPAGLGRSKTFELLSVATTLSAEHRDAIRGTEIANSRRDLLSLVQLAEPDRNAVIELIGRQEASSVGDALKVLHPTESHKETAPALNDEAPERLDVSEMELHVYFGVPANSAHRSRPGGKLLPKEREDAHHSFRLKMTPDQRANTDLLRENIERLATMAVRDHDLNREWTRVP